MSDQVNYEFIDPETGEAFEINATSLVANVRDIIMSRRKLQTQAKTWPDLSETEQRDEITAVQELARDLVGKVVEAVAEKGMTCAHVEVSKFAVDVEKGEVTITSKGFASDEMLSDLAHAKGKVAKLTVVDERQFNQKATPLEPDPDQKPLFGEDPAEAPADEMSEQEVEDLGAEMDAEAEAMDEPDDLHAESEKPAEWHDGFNARFNGVDSQDNPYDIDSAEREEWYLGWKKADDDPEAPEIAEASPKAEPEAEAAEDREKALMAAHADGQAARLADLGPDENPHDGGTDEHSQWKEGYDLADKDVQKVIEGGRQAKRDGKAKKDCTWKKGSDAERFWLQGYNETLDEAAA